MIRHPLPPCRWRGHAVAPGQYECRSHQAQLAGCDATTRECLDCPVRDHEPKGPPPGPVEGAGAIRHLAYFVYPRGEEWRPNLAQLRQRISLFNGRRLVAVATSAQTASAVDVAEELAGLDVEVLPFANDPALREMSAYPTLMRALSVYRDPANVHWYGHAKGITSAQWAPAVRHWRECMYEAQLDYWPLIRERLRDAAAVGQYLRPRHLIPGSPCRFHFSGSFCWRRHVPLYDREWDNYDQHWCGSESHLGRVYRVGEVHSLYGDRPPRGLDLYLSSVWEGGLLADHRNWCDDHADQRQEPMLASVILTSAWQPALVHDAIASVRGQQSDSWQLVIMDAGDLAAAGAFDRYKDDPRIVLLTTGETADERATTCIQGVAINRALASGRVRGDVLVCLSDDDQLDAGWLRAVLDRAAARPAEQAWVGRADVVEVLPNGATRPKGQLSISGRPGPGNPLRCRVDGCQLAVRRSAWRPWPEDRGKAPEADGYWMDAVAAAVEVHPLAVRAAVHRHTPLSTFTRPAG